MVSPLDNGLLRKQFNAHKDGDGGGGGGGGGVVNADSAICLMVFGQ